MNASSRIALVLSLFVLGDHALAEDGDRYQQSSFQLRADRARVIEVERVGGQYSTRLSQECWDESTRRHEPGYYRDNSGRLYRGENSGKAGTVIGAIIGGVLGNQIGSGDGRKAATVAGAVIGGAVGSKHGQNDRRYADDGYDYYGDESGVVRRCRTVEEPGGGYGRRGYQVTYEYAGQTYQAFSLVRPGRTIPVLVDVRPR
ncbi:glycine zipper 2TM domain-containing protein [Pseudomarimonas salicorniae]|uniref:Glycine zipper 2TM domain-containing protein n=1 Tax=Pseudomarimonas salicorniae TaxID=2933270 RepID=A0ABT0GJB6_9GAMM|nr:glycine zipper 2TM domain-containing protein [Lysobacter sp. CAU 1642]MCK7594637.1 glycine zipper 2TM domain-containing protein [Lysobacter sp. CAU 1642]